MHQKSITKINMTRLVRVFASDIISNLLKNKIKKVSLIFLALLVSQQSFAGYYTDFATPLAKNLVTDYGVDNYDNDDDSKNLQKAIDELSAKNGGEIIIPDGVYYFINIELKSNIKILIDQNASIRPYLEGSFKKKGGSVFTAGKKNPERIKNVVITSLQKDKRFTVELPVIRSLSSKKQAKAFNQVHGIRVFHFMNVENFNISNVNVYDSQTKYSVVTLNPIVKEKNRGNLPTNGDIKNITVFNSAYGYGAVQAQGANNVYFENILSEGGSALRLETGYSVMNDLQVGGVSNINANNIRCINGSAALTLSPHAIQRNNNINAQNITSDSCNFAVRIAAGYVASKYKNKKLQPGFFTNVTIKGINATFGMRSQILHKDFVLLPKELQRYIYRRDTELENLVGPSIAVIGYVGGKENYKVSLQGITSHGFQTKEVIHVNDKYKLYTKEK